VPFVLLMNRQQLLARFRSARIRGFKSRTSATETGLQSVRFAL
jgi:hypothetical protein